MTVRVMRFPTAVRRDPGVDAWFEARSGELGRIARHWFEVMRDCGEDVRELLHDGQPTACVGDAAFAYVDAFTAHVNVGFFGGSALHRAAALPFPPGHSATGTPDRVSVGRRSREMFGEARTATLRETMQQVAMHTAHRRVARGPSA